VIDVRCPCGCKQIFHADEFQIGKKIRCPHSGQIVVIERPQSSYKPREPSAVTSWMPNPPSASPPHAPSTVSTAVSGVSGLRRRAFQLGRPVKAALVALLLLAVGIVTYILTAPPDEVVHTAAVATAQSTRGPQDRSPSPPQSAPSHISGDLGAGYVPPPERRLLPPKPACAVGESPERFYTGYRLEPDTGTAGQCSLRIYNGSEGDAAVRVLWSGTEATARFVYIRSGEACTFRDVEPGSYDLRWDTGEDWIPRCGYFLRDNAYSTFGRPLDFSVRWDSEDQVPIYHGHKVTLYVVPNGNIEKQPIDRAKFLEGDRYFSANP